MNLLSSLTLLGSHASVTIFCLQKEFGSEEGQRMFTLFWDVTLYSLVEKYHVSEKPIAFIFYPEEEAAVFFKTSITTCQIRRDDSGDLSLEIMYGKLEIIGRTTVIHSSDTFIL
jgi:hypothetical protein